MSDKPVVAIVMGSDSDATVMLEAREALEKLGIPSEVHVSSAHRSPDRTRRIAKSAQKRGIRVIIAGAGSAAHLAGFLAAETCLPVIGVPIDSSALKGIDALLSTVQMPAGVPVATMAIGVAGARNAAILAAQILAFGDPEVCKRLSAFRHEMAAGMIEKEKKVRNRILHMKNNKPGGS
jgi:5-(carboxyamino)imidazole ribonucleotide mutase